MLSNELQSDDSFSNLGQMKKFYPEDYFKRSGYNFKPLVEKQGKKDYQSKSIVSGKSSNSKVSEVKRMNLVSETNNQSVPIFERFNERLAYRFEKGKSPRMRQKSLKKSELDLIQKQSEMSLTKHDGETSKTMFQSIQNLAKATASSKCRSRDNSTVKTNDIIRMIKGVNELTDKANKLEREKYLSTEVIIDTGANLTENAKVNYEEALETVQNILREEGIYLDPETQEFMDENGNKVEIDL